MGMICGLFERRGGLVTDLEGMLAALPGRDGDAVAAWAEGPVAFGWRGDAPAGGAGSGPPAGADALAGPPIPLERDAGAAVAASVRIDGRAALRDALGVPRGERRPSDAALVLRAFRRWGAECPRRLLGDYAFAAWDAGRRELLLARDHIGARPLYYSLTAGRVVFASDVNAVLAAPGVPQALDEAVVATWLERFQASGERTFHRSVRRLPPGHLLAVGSRSARLERWWRPEDVPQASVGDDDAIAEALLALYAEAVADRLRGPQPVGVHLSGGLDSSSVAALAARALREAGRPPPPAFSWQPPPDGTDRGAEYRHIEAVARQEGLSVAWCPPAPDDILAALRRDVTRHANLSENEWAVQRCAAERRVRVLLSGTGGDEGMSFSGRGYAAYLLRQLRIGPLWREMRARGRHPLARMALEAALPLAWPAAADRVQILLWRFNHGRRPLLVRPRPSFLHPAVARRVELLSPPTPPAGMRHLQLYLMRHSGVGTRLDAWAASGARLGIEYRYPLLDRRLLEFVLGLPADQFRRGSESRSLMRRTLAGVLPEPVRRQAKDPDPVRMEAYKDSFRAALVEVRGTLAARSEPPSRSAYLDMASLQRHLDAAPQDYRGRLRIGALTRALKFLDF